MNNYSIKKTPIDIRLELAKKHRVLRKKMHWSQEELARRSGVSLGSVKRFESIGQISLESLLKLVFVLGRLNEFEQLLQPQKDLKAIEQLFSDNARK